MDTSVKANLFGGQFSISLTLNCIDFKSEVITIVKNFGIMGFGID